MTPSKDAGGEPSQRRVKMTTDDLHQVQVDLARRGIRVTVAGMLRATDAARVLDRSVKTLTNWRSQGTGPPHVAIGGTIYYKLDDVLTYLEAGRGQPARPRMSRDRLAIDKRTGEHDAMYLPTSRLSIAVPTPVALEIRRLAAERGCTTTDLLAAALRNFEPVANALKSTPEDSSNAAKTS